MQESDLDRTFMGQWEITRVDDYLTQKAGTSIRNTVIRSRVDLEKGVICLYSHLPTRYGLDPIVADGTYGICGKIVERIKIDSGKPNVSFLYLRVNKGEDILSSLKKVGPGRYTLQGIAEIDDVVFNAQEDYTFPFTYYLKGEKQPYLWGVSIEIPIGKYNHYVKMRNVWYHDYEGSQVVTSEDVSSH